MFAFDDAATADRPVVYMIGMPYSTGPVTFDANSELYLMRLLSLMPPIAERPFFQEGFLVGSEFPRRDLKALHEADLSCRIIAKFELAGDRKQWERDLGKVDRSAIYPNDRFSSITREIRLQLVEEGYIPLSKSEFPGIFEIMEQLKEKFPYIPEDK